MYIFSTKNTHSSQIYRTKNILEWNPKGDTRQLIQIWSITAIKSRRDDKTEEPEIGKEGGQLAAMTIWWSAIRKQRKKIKHQFSSSSHFSALSPASKENINGRSQESFLLKQEMEERRSIIILRYNPEHSTKHCFSDVSLVFSFSWLTSASTFEALAIASSIAILSSSLTLALELRGSVKLQQTLLVGR